MSENVKISHSEPMSKNFRHIVISTQRWEKRYMMTSQVCTLQICKKVWQTDGRTERQTDGKTNPSRRCFSHQKLLKLVRFLPTFSSFCRLWRDPVESGLMSSPHISPAPGSLFSRFGDYELKCFSRLHFIFGSSVHAHTPTHIHTHTHIHIHTHTHTLTHRRTQTHTHTHRHTIRQRQTGKNSHTIRCAKSRW